MRYAVAALILTAGSAFAGLPQSTLGPLPQSTLNTSAGCFCPAGETCVCAPGTCQCPGCKCQACPGKQRPEGVALDYADAFQAAQKYGVPMVAFIHLPARPIRGCVAYRSDPVDGTARVWVGNPQSPGVYLPADAIDSAIMVAANPGKPIVRYQQVCNEFGCKQLPVFGDAPVTYTNAALMAPPMAWPMQPNYQMSYGGNCASGNCH